MQKNDTIKKEGRNVEEQDMLRIAIFFTFGAILSGCGCGPGALATFMGTESSQERRLMRSTYQFVGCTKIKQKSKNYNQGFKIKLR